MDTYNTNISVRFQDGRTETLTAVSFTFRTVEHPVSEPYQTNSGAFEILTWLTLNIAPFEGWTQATLFDFEFPFDDYSQQAVTGPPRQEGLWLLFPVRSQDIEMYTDFS